MRELLLDTAVTKYLPRAVKIWKYFSTPLASCRSRLIDTQILAAFSGRPLSWGFAAMVEEYAGLTLDKRRIAYRLARASADGASA